MRYMGGTDPIKALGTQAKVSQVTNTYATPGEHIQNYIRHVQSLGRASRCMCFMEIMQKWENNEIEEIMLTLQPHLNSAPIRPMQAFPETLPLSGNLVSG